MNAAPRPAAIAFTPAMRVLIDAMGALIAIPSGHDHWPQLIAVLAEVLPQVRATGAPAPDVLIRAAVQLAQAEPARRRWMARVGATDADRQAAGEVALAAEAAAARAVHDFFFWRWSLSNEAWRATLAPQGAVK